MSEQQQQHRADDDDDRDDFNEDEVLARYKVWSHDVGDKVISLAEDVVLTCDNWRDPKSNVTKLELSMDDPTKKHLIFYDMWSDEVVHEILCVLQRCPYRQWTTIEFRGCQEKHVHQVLECVLEMDVVQVVVFSLTNERFDPRRRTNNSTFDVISRKTSSTARTTHRRHSNNDNSSTSTINQRLQCIVFHQRPLHFIQYESLKDLNVKHLHFLDGIMLHPNEIPELAQGLMANTSLKSFSFLGGVMNTGGTTTTSTTSGGGAGQMMSGIIQHDVSAFVLALTSHPSLQRLSLNLKSTSGNGVIGLQSLLSSETSALRFLTLTGGFPLNTFFPPGTFSQGLKTTKVRHLQLRDIFLFDHDVQDLASGLQQNSNNHQSLSSSIESLSLGLDAYCSVDVSNIALALQSNQNLKRLALTGRCSLGKGVHGVAKILKSSTCQLEDLHLSGAFNDQEKILPDFLTILVDGLRNNKILRSLDLSRNGLTNHHAASVYNVLWTCPMLSSLDLGMNEVTSTSIESFSKQDKASNLAVLRISSPVFSFFQINDKLCKDLVTMLNRNPKLGDINFNMGRIDWHQTYDVKDDRMKWHHFSPSYRVYSLHSNNKRVEYLKAKDLKPEGRKDLEKAQFLLDYNWAGRSVAAQEKSLPLSVWPKILARVMSGRRCFWTGRREPTDNLGHRHDVTFGLLRGTLGSSLNNEHLENMGEKRRRFCMKGEIRITPAKKQKLYDREKAVGEI
eukprot:CAMPEP_0113497574 /NCGR_PEP_ID=MMETSP0014_2-20120614/30703_1 /TAXON_ID=2857 /ORGANISM="Nitzschia sp." /LENGTH=731 /DNA_ID=CAMNT_0000391523 /DNA_START=115 /DNA_END=2310 /DNA_ORIENTATION=- /assembly_acc=CAM_ASM_000159